MKMIANADPDFETTHRPKARWRQKVYEFITGENFKHNYFDFFVMGCIILNMFQMAASYEGATLEFNNILDYINYFFTTVFVVEATLKLISYGGTYF